MNFSEISNALATAVTNDQGRFIIEGNTANYQGTEGPGKFSVKFPGLKFPRKFCSQHRPFPEDLPQM